MQQAFAVSERRGCGVLGQSRYGHRYTAQLPEAEERLSESIVSPVTKCGRCGFRRITTILPWDRWEVNHKRAERIRRRKALKVPRWQPTRGRLWVNDGSCVPGFVPCTRDHVWSHGFVADRTHNGRPLRLLTCDRRVIPRVPGNPGG